MKLYKWQEQLAKKYDGKGIVKGVPGSGKTIGAINLIKKQNYKNVLIAVPTLPLKRQWKTELERFKVNARVETFHKLYKPNNIECDLFIIDECHRSTSPMFIKMYREVNYKHILGLSATPNILSQKRCGPIIIKVSLEEANIADFTVNFVSIELTPNEKLEYDRLSQQLRSMLRDESSMHPQQKEIIDAIVFKRRSIVYSAKNRVPKTCKILDHYKNKNVLMICQRIEQADWLSTLTGYPVYHSKNQNDAVLRDFKNGIHSKLISVGMLKEGFDKRDIDCLIIVSTALTEAHHIQAIGRAIRIPNDATIYILLAKDTTDEKVLKFKTMYKHKIIGSFSGKYDMPVDELTKLYYASKTYSMDYKHRIFQTKKYGREYFQFNPIINHLKEYLPIGGRFRISKDNRVMVMFKNKVVVVDKLTEELVPSQILNPTRDLW